MLKPVRTALGVGGAMLCAAALVPATTAQAATQFVYRSTATSGDVTDAQGNLWKAHGGLTGGRGTSEILKGKPIALTTDPTPYTQNVWGAQGYQVPVPAAGSYTVTLFMAEDFFHTAGARVFNVDAEGQRELSNVDIFASVGYATAYTRSFDVTVNDGELDLDVSSVVQNPLVSGIEVRATGTAENAPTTGQPTTPVATTSPTTAAPTAAPTTAAPTAAPTTAAPAAPATGAVTGAASSDHAVKFASNSFWTQDISQAPLASNSSAQASSIAKQVSDWYGGVAAFNAYRYNVSLYTAAPDQAKVDVKWVDCQGKGSVPDNIYTGKAYFKGVPIPTAAQPAGGNDGELSVYDPTHDQLWEFWQAEKVNGAWQACWGGRIDNVSTNQGMFPESFGVSATNVALTGGMITLADVRRGYINHAMSVSIMNPAPFTQLSWPAQRSDGSLDGGGIIREGQRFRLDPSLDLSKYQLTPVAKMIAVAAQKYGFVVSDKGGAVAVSTEAGDAEKAMTGTNPWDTLLAGTHDYAVMKNFPWDQTQFVPVDYGKP